MARLVVFLIQDGWCLPAIRLARFPGLGVASLGGLQFLPLGHRIRWNAG